MNTIDMRTMGEEAKTVLKKQIIRLKKQAKSEPEISEITGMSRSAINRVWLSYCNAGCKILKERKRGRKTCSGRKLTLEQENEVRKTLTEKTPDQVGLSCYLWTRGTVGEYVYRKYKVKITQRSLGEYLKRWGMSCQCPAKRAYTQDSARVNQFMGEEYPAIAVRAKKEGAQIFWGDEVGISNQENYQRGYSLKGYPPILKVSAKKERLNMISAIANNGSVRFMIYDDTMNQQRLIDFMRRLIKPMNHKVFLILDNLRVHHGKKVKKWLEEHEKEIEVFYLPPYAPERNPDEYLNHALKRDVHSGLHPRTKDDIRHKVQSFMRRLQHHARRVSAFFDHPMLAYATPGICPPK